MNKNSIVKAIQYLPTPRNIRVWWNFGSMLGLILGIQILTGFMLSLYYNNHVEEAFSSVVHIVRDVPFGWLIRNLHANGASVYFLMLYIHIARSIYYQRYLTNRNTWLIGCSIYLVRMAAAFLGYVLPWGQMSFWGATVITNFLSAIPYFGGDMVEWVWGGFSVGQPTLSRFYRLHFILPLAIVLIVFIHLVFLHDKGRSNPLGSIHHLTKTTFHPYFTYKDAVGFVLILIVLTFLVFYFPNYMGDRENFIEANRIVTPVHIIPEWYFLFAYAILRRIPSKLGGVVALAARIVILFVLPYIQPKFMIFVPSSFNVVYQVVFWVLIRNFILLTWLGSCTTEYPFTTVSQVSSILYFASFGLLVMSQIFRKYLVYF
jgi:ubiquinol-cytochrome c reductase cytochrome b subunit